MATDPHLSDAQIAEIQARAVEGVQFHAVQDRAALLAHIEDIEKAARTGPWLVARKRDTEPWEVHWFDRYDHAALHFDALQAQWSTVFFCRVAHCEGKPLDVMPVVNGFAERLAQAEAALQAQIARNDALCEGYEAEVRQRNQQLIAQAERIAQLVDSLRTFGTHRRRCQCVQYMSAPCDCGLMAALASPSPAPPERTV